MLGRTTSNSESSKTSARHMRWWVLVAPVFNLVLIVLVGWWILKSGCLPGGVPVTAAWYGMVGGFAASLTGMFYHNEKWDDSFDLWHFCSGIVGAIFGVAAYLALTVVGSSSAACSSPSPAILLGALVAGFFQQKFTRYLRTKFDGIFGAEKAKGNATVEADSQSSNASPGSTPDPKK